MFLLSTAAARAESIDLRRYQSSVKDQGDRNTCAYFAVTAMVEAFVKTRFGKEFDISEEFQIYHGKTHFKEYADKEFGSTYDVAVNFRSQRFFLTEDVVPYQTSLFAPGRECAAYDPFDVTAPAICFSQGPYPWRELPRVRIDGLEVHWLSGLWSFGKPRAELIVDEIRQGNPVVLTLKVYPGTWDGERVTYDDAINEKCEAGAYTCAGHAVLLTGFDTVTREFTFKNSWGERWGDGGYGRLSFDYVNRFSDTPITFRWDRILAGLREVP